MRKKILERYWKGPSDLREHKVISGAFEEIRCDICAGSVFPALRENEIHLYHEGGRVLRIKPQSAYTHARYNKCGGDEEVPVRSLTNGEYRDIKECCRTHNSSCLSDGQYRERWIVSRWFERFSIWADKADPDQPKLIDIEVRLRLDQGRSAKMVDLLFLDGDARLTFVEVKRQYDRRIRSGDPQREPKVVKQVRRYETALQRHQGSVLCAYRDVGKLLSRAFVLGSEGFDAATTVFRRVPILVCRRDDRPGQDHWLKERLASCAKGEVDPRYLVVDGGAVDAYAAFGGSRRCAPWCDDGVWENLNIKMLFAKIRSVEGSGRRDGSAQ